MSNATPTLYFEGAGSAVWHGDCIETMRLLEPDSVDAVVTDPPYGLEFMGREWDKFPKPSGTAQGPIVEGTDESHPFRDGSTRIRYGRTDMGAFQLWCEEWAREAFRVLKPGGHLLAFGGSRTWHRLAAGIEDAGYELRDSIAWLYSTGFPKSLDVSQAIDKSDAGRERLARASEFQAWLSQHLTAAQVNTITGTDMGHHLTTHPTQPSIATADMFDLLRHYLPPVPERIEALVTQRTVESKNHAARKVVADGYRVDRGTGSVPYGSGTPEGHYKITTAHTDEAREWEGWGTALAPAFEPIVVARKPLTGTVAANVLRYGVGGLNIGATRTEHSSDADRRESEQKNRHADFGTAQGGNSVYGDYSMLDPRANYDGGAGRWPKNVLLTHAPLYDESGQIVGDACADGCVPGCQVAELDLSSGVSKSPPVGSVAVKAARVGQVSKGDERARVSPNGHGDSGGASRFFPTFRYEAKAPTAERPSVVDEAGNTIMHPTVKPLDLMRWLIRLVTPPGGLVLEPFAGSGTTVEAAIVEGDRCTAIELGAEHLPLIRERMLRQPSVIAERMHTGEHEAPEGVLF